MRVLVQRVSEAMVTIEGKTVGKIGRGIAVFVGIRQDDTRVQADLLVRKILNLRIFPDEEGKMNRSVLDILGDVLIVSQFTLYGDTRKGNRPSYSEAAKPEIAKPLYDHFVQICREAGIFVASGVFQAHMDVKLVNEGPVTLLCVSESQAH
jgi:D-aminoacyl-tRNA deacylase